MIGFLVVTGLFVLLWDTARRWGGKWGRWAVILLAFANWFSGLWIAHVDGVEPSLYPSAILAMVLLLARQDRKQRTKDDTEPAGVVDAEARTDG